MLFLTFSKTNIQFAEKKFICRFYTIVKALLIIKQIDLINKKKFAKLALDKNFETFIVHVAVLASLLAR